MSAEYDRSGILLKISPKEEAKHIMHKLRHRQLQSITYFYCYVEKGFMDEVASILVANGYKVQLRSAFPKAAGIYLTVAQAGS